MSWFLRQFVTDLDLSQDRHWVMTFNPYEGKVTPSWWITAMARCRMGA